MFNIYNFMLAGGFVVFALVDTVAPARDYPAARWWRLRGVASAALYLALASYTPYLWMDIMADVTMFDASSLPLALSIAVGYAVMQFFHYLWHRALHHFEFLWRAFHQMHHSAERLDIYGALYFHPLDMLGFTFVSSFALTVVFGLTPQAAAITGVLAGLISLFSHANLRTPRWLGSLIARPELHAVHHQRGRHGSNYGDLMVWDLLFGTFYNPKHWDDDVGFYDGASDRVVDTLLMRDVSRPPPEASMAPAVLQKSRAAKRLLSTPSQWPRETPKKRRNGLPGRNIV
ncbi:MAG: sterol desaturase family protein [Gammaproteobacteria bacterium]